MIRSVVDSLELVPLVPPPPLPPPPPSVAFALEEAPEEPVALLALAVVELALPVAPLEGPVELGVPLPAAV